MLGRAVVTKTSLGKKYSFGVPYNAAHGNYKFSVTDYETGLATEKIVKVK